MQKDTQFLYMTLDWVDVEVKYGKVFAGFNFCIDSQLKIRHIHYHKQSDKMSEIVLVVQNSSFWRKHNKVYFWILVVVASVKNENKNSTLLTLWPIWCPINIFLKLLLGPFRSTLLLGPPMVNKFQDPDNKTPTNVVGSFMIFVAFSFQIGYNIGLEGHNYGYFIVEIRDSLEYLHYGVEENFEFRWSRMKDLSLRVFGPLGRALPHPRLLHHCSNKNVPCD